MLWEKTAMVCDSMLIHDIYSNYYPMAYFYLIKRIHYTHSAGKTNKDFSHKKRACGKFKKRELHSPEMALRPPPYHHRHHHLSKKTLAVCAQHVDLRLGSAQTVPDRIF